MIKKVCVIIENDDGLFIVPIKKPTEKRVELLLKMIRNFNDDLENKNKKGN